MQTNPLAEASFAYQQKWAPVRRVLPRPVRRAFRSCYFLGLDVLDACLGRRRDMVPPRIVNPIGDGSFEGTGDEFLEYFVRLGNLRPSDHVLDIGCGIGRMARPLTRYLTTGTYDGFDINPRGIRWCERNITTRYPAFRFLLADIRNTEYNAKGTLPAAEYRFPYADARFDFAFLTSVLTHMLPRETSHYMSELFRVLKPGGNCLATFFLLNEEASRLISSGRSSLNLSNACSGFWTTNSRVPETAVGYDEGNVFRLLQEKGFTLSIVCYGNWCGRKDYHSYQDIVVFRKA